MWPRPIGRWRRAPTPTVSGLPGCCHLGSELVCRSCPSQSYKRPPHRLLPSQLQPSTLARSHNPCPEPHHPRPPLPRSERHGAVRGNHRHLHRAGARRSAGPGRAACGGLHSIAGGCGRTRHPLGRASDHADCAAGGIAGPVCRGWVLGWAGVLEQLMRWEAGRQVWSDN